MLHFADASTCSCTWYCAWIEVVCFDTSVDACFGNPVIRGCLCTTMNGRCCMQGGLPPEWTQCSSGNSTLPCMSALSNMSCTSCNLSGSLSAYWLSMNLQQLTLAHNSMSGSLAGPSAPSEASRMVVLDLAYNTLQSAADESFWNHTRANLRQLRLQANQLADALSSRYTKRVA